MKWVTFVFKNCEYCLPVCVFPQQELPPYNGFGSLEDSLQSCLSLVPQPPKKDFIKMLENDHKILRFEAVMVSAQVRGSIMVYNFCTGFEKFYGKKLIFSIVCIMSILIEYVKLWVGKWTLCFQWPPLWWSCVGGELLYLCTVLMPKMLISIAIIDGK